MSIDSDRPASRRAVLGAVLGGAAALGVQALASAPVVLAANGDPLALGHADNAATDPTVLTADLATKHVLEVVNSTADPAKTSVGVLGHAADGVGVEGTSDTNIGVYGGTADQSSASAFTDYTGVYGFVDGTGVDQSQFLPTGVWGDSIQGAGVFGSGPNGVIGVGVWGIYGYSDQDGGVGIYAESRRAGYRPECRRQGPLQPEREGEHRQDKVVGQRLGAGSDCGEHGPGDPPGEQDRPLHQGRRRVRRQDHDLPQQEAPDDRQGRLPRAGLTS